MVNAYTGVHLLRQISAVHIPIVILLEPTVD